MPNSTYRILSNTSCESIAPKIYIYLLMTKNVVFKNINLIRTFIATE